jgi:hypothetical protein
MLDLVVLDHLKMILCLAETFKVTAVIKIVTFNLILLEILNLNQKGS